MKKYLAFAIEIRSPKTVFEQRVNVVLQLFDRLVVNEEMIEKEVDYLQSICMQLPRKSKVKRRLNYVRPCRLSGRKDVRAFRVGSFARIQFHQLGYVDKIKKVKTSRKHVQVSREIE